MCVCASCLNLGALFGGSQKNQTAQVVSEGPTCVSTECVVVPGEHGPTQGAAEGQRGRTKKRLDSQLGSSGYVCQEGKSPASVKCTKEGPADFPFSVRFFPLGARYLSQRNVNYQMRPLIVPLRVKPSS